MAVQILQLPYCDGEPRHETDWFRLKKGSLEADCGMFSHQLGWECGSRLAGRVDAVAGVSIAGGSAQRLGELARGDEGEGLAREHSSGRTQADRDLVKLSDLANEWREQFNL